MPGATTTDAEGLGSKRDFVIYLGTVIAVGASLSYLLRDANQTLAATTLLATVLGTLMFWRFRLAIAFLGLVVLLSTHTVDLSTAIEFMNIHVILFIVGMMVIVGSLRQVGFFRWFAVRLLGLTRFEPHWLLLMILVLSSVMAALIDEVTSIVFTTALVIDLCDHFGQNPAKYIIATVLATNIGSSWTAVGNPIGILIAFESGLSFEHFVRFALPVGVISLLFLIAIVFIWFRKDIPGIRQSHRAELATGGIRHRIADAGKPFLAEEARIKDKRLFTGSVVIFALVVVFLILSHRLELLLGLESNTLLFAAPICGAGIIMLWRRREAREFIQRDVDWWTLMFFMFLFAQAGCLQYVGITDRIAGFMLGLAQGTNTLVPVVMLLWVSGFLSALADNVVVVAALSPVAQTLSTQLNTSAPWWALLFGGCYGGNMMMIGSTANIVALGVLEKRTGHLVRIGYWLRIGLPASLVPMAIGTAAILLFTTPSI